MNKQIILTTILIILPNIVQAQVYECNGRWTNVPCAGKQGSGKSGDNSSQPNEAEKSIDVQAASKKGSLLHELTMKSIKAKEQYSIRTDLSELENFCLKQNSTLEECRKRIAETEAELDRKIVSQGALAAQKKSVELQEKANKLQEERNKIEENNQTVIVVKERPYWRKRKGPHTLYNVHGGQIESEVVGGSIQVDASSASGDTKVSVSAGASSGTSNTIVETDYTGTAGSISDKSSNHNEAGGSLPSKAISGTSSSHSSGGKRNKVQHRR